MWRASALGYEPFVGRPALFAAKKAKPPAALRASSLRVRLVFRWPAQRGNQRQVVRCDPRGTASMWLERDQHVGGRDPDAVERGDRIRRGKGRWRARRFE